MWVLVTFPPAHIVISNTQAYYLIYKMKAKKEDNEICAAAPNHVLPFCCIHILDNVHLRKALFYYSQVEMKQKDQLRRT